MQLVYTLFVPAVLLASWLVHVTRTTLDRAGSAHYDCFPGGHGELTIIAWWSGRRISKRLSRVYLAYTLEIIFGTV